MNKELLTQLYHKLITQSEEIENLKLLLQSLQDANDKYISMIAEEIELDSTLKLEIDAVNN